MSSVPDSDDWAGARGRKWLEGLEATEAMLAPVTAPLIGALQTDGARLVADIGCGGGGATGTIAEVLPATAVVHGHDISPDLIDAARKAHHDPRVSFFCSDAQRVVPEETYDRLVSRFGIMFFPDPPAAFQNLHRWLQPGGRFAFAVWGPPPENPWMMIMHSAVAAHLPMPSPEPDTPGPFRYADTGPLLDLLAASGFSDLAVTRWTDKLKLGGGHDSHAAADFALDALSVAELADGDATALARIRDGLVGAFLAHETDGVVQLQGSVSIVTGISD